MPNTARSASARSPSTTRPRTAALSFPTPGSFEQYVDDLAIQQHDIDELRRVFEIFIEKSKWPNQEALLKIYTICFPERLQRVGMSYIRNNIVAPAVTGLSKLSGFQLQKRFGLSCTTPHYSEKEEKAITALLKDARQYCWYHALMLDTCILKEERTSQRTMTWPQGSVNEASKVAGTIDCFFRLRKLSEVRKLVAECRSRVREVEALFNSVSS
ncbi:hypothetical protein P389DRAFT_202867 [Cystobasidium minutum MCA 4210]|uniref:uncharacterized protein n=1 Tax=Cystobasidium minutum MCA 4210 TaxID=1397322 RepID=UPI0034CFB279|eukprot:jgi/Rhomi1/202867/MIX3696_18_38